MKKVMTALILFLTAIMPIQGCADRHEKAFPEFLDRKGNISLQEVISGKDAQSVLDKNETIQALLDEFSPTSIHLGRYLYRGITIHFVLARLPNTDTSYGLYSNLTLFARERWPMYPGEISYKPPFVAGWEEKYVAWCYSPTHPKNYFAFYKEQIAGTLHGLNPGSIPDQKALLSYHSRILPDASRFLHSTFYIKKRVLFGIPIEKAYCAYYGGGRTKALFAVETHLTPVEAENKFKKVRTLLKKQGAKVKRYTRQTGGMGTGYFWKEKNVYHVFFQYKWILMGVFNVSHLKYSQFIFRGAFSNMLRIRHEVIPEKKRNIFIEQQEKLKKAEIK